MNCLPRYTLTPSSSFPKLAIMEVQLTPEQEAELSKLASQRGREPQQLAEEVLTSYLENEARFVEAVQRGIESLNRGECISHEEVGARINRLFPA